METNAEKLERLGIETDTDSVMDYAGESVCALCMEENSHYLSPQNPACEGKWCDEAVERWLGEPVEEAEE